MDDDFFDIVELVSKYMTGELTGTERESLDNWLPKKNLYTGNVRS